MSFWSYGVTVVNGRANPGFQTLMRPLLDGYGAGSERAVSDVRRELAKQFQLSEDELAERLPSGLARTFDNRVRTSERGASSM